MRYWIVAAPFLMACVVGACATTSVPRPGIVLSEDQVIDLMKRPRAWDGRVITVKIYPFDRGDPKSYLVCFEPCDEAYARSSPFVIVTREGRFNGAKGDRPAVVTAQYDSACLYRTTLCADGRFGLFRETGSPQGS